MNYYFISPHLDDAIFSAGNLISQLKKHSSVTVISVFTQAPEGSDTLFCKLFIRKSGFNNAKGLFNARKKEDLEVCRSLGLNAVHLDFIDLAWRRKRKQNNILAFIPEFSHLYPTRFHILSGKIHKEDAIMLKKITKKLQRIIKNDDSVVFCPLGIGKQVDHIIVRNICTNNFKKVVYWQDYPYVIKGQTPDKKFIADNNLNEVTLRGLFSKNKTILGYKSQIKAYFKNGIIKNTAEKYYSHDKSTLDLISHI